VNGQAIAKVLIVTVVFPVLVIVLFTVLTVPVGFVLTPLFAKAGDWSRVIQAGFVGVTLVIALIGSFGLRRQCWPREKTDRTLKLDES
jgi:membrane protein YdbS with pleckstrin-like domain